MTAVPVAVFSDFTCPFSYVTEAALRRLEREGLAAPRYLAFELYPAPGPPPPPPDPAQVEAARPLAQAEGVPLAAPPLGARTGKAHEAAIFAGQRGAGAAFRDAVFAAYWGQGRDVERIDVLVELGAALGLDATEMKVVLDVDTHAAAVRQAGALARRLGVEGTPALVVGEGERARLLVGAGDYATLREAVEEASS